MGDEIRVQPFSADLLEEVRDFHCGAEPWEVEVAEWIKNPNIEDCAVNWMRRGAQVWLYRTDGGSVIGYGSLGTTKWRLRPDAAREPVCIIPAFAIDLRLQGEPRNLSWEERYSTRIIADLISRGASLGPRALGLFVDKRNARAIAFYNRIGFRALPDEGGDYLKMYLELEAESVPE